MSKDMRDPSRANVFSRLNIEAGAVDNEPAARCTNSKEGKISEPRTACACHGLKLSAVWPTEGIFKLPL